MKIDYEQRHINLDQNYNLENIPQISPISALDHLELARSILYGAEPYLAKIVDAVLREPECRNDEKFWIECKINRLISFYLRWFKGLILNFEVQINTARLPKNQLKIMIGFLMEFLGDENSYTYNYTFLKIQKESKDD